MTKSRKESLKKAKELKRQSINNKVAKKQSEFAKLSPEDLIKRNIEERKRRESEERKIKSIAKKIGFDINEISCYNGKITQNHFDIIIFETLKNGKYLSKDQRQSLSSKLNISENTLNYIEAVAVTICFPNDYNAKESLLPESYIVSMIKSYEKFKNIFK